MECQEGGDDICLYRNSKQKSYTRNTQIFTKKEKLVFIRVSAAKKICSKATFSIALRADTAEVTWSDAQHGGNVFVRNFLIESWVAFQ